MTLPCRAVSVSPSSRAGQNNRLQNADHRFLADGICKIDIAIEYTDLSEQQRKNIFSEFLRQLQAKNLVSDINAALQWVDEVGKEKDFNGRQIRNVVSTAMAIANADDTKLAPTHLNEVCKHVTQFKKALQEQETLFRAAQIENRKQGY